MTINDDNSVYVGGLPYDATEESVCKVFDLYGHIKAVKIINDHAIGGKCYGFVTYTNPRSAINAINDMDGRKFEGRVVKVNEVKTRGGRSNLGRDSFRRNSERGRDRERDHDQDRDWDRHRERSRDRDHDKERGYDRARDHEQIKVHFMGRERGRDPDRDMKDIGPEHGRSRSKEWGGDSNSDRDQDLDIMRSNNRHRRGDDDKVQISKFLNGSDFNDHRTRELSSESSDDDHEQVEKQLDISYQKLEELQMELSQMEDTVEEKGQLVSKLQEKSQVLVDALAAAKKLTSQRQMQLTKLLKCFMHMKDYSERLKVCEHELQIEVECDDDDVGVKNGILANGNA